MTKKKFYLRRKNPYRINDYHAFVFSSSSLYICLDNAKWEKKEKENSNEREKKDDNDKKKDFEW